MARASPTNADGWLERRLNHNDRPRQILDPVATGANILAVAAGSALRDIIPVERPSWPALRAPAEWASRLLPHRRLQSAAGPLPGQGRDPNLLYASPPCRLGDCARPWSPPYVEASAPGPSQQRLGDRPALGGRAPRLGTPLAGHDRAARVVARPRSRTLERDQLQALAHARQTN